MPRETTPTRERTPAVERAGSDSLVSLLGDQRATIVDHLRRVGDATAGELAQVLGISEVATRRHLAVLEAEGLTAAEVATSEGPGRPAAHHRLTDKARRLLPSRSAALATELMDFITDEHGREGLRAYLTWRLERQADELSARVTADGLPERLGQLADALSDAGYHARVSADGESFQLTQEHCAIYDVARDHPEICAYEAATFARVLGRDVSLSRRDTLAAGASACVCCVSPRGSADVT